MADDILTGLEGNVSNLDALKSSLSDVLNLRNQLAQVGDITGFRETTKLTKAIQQQIKVLEEQKSLKQKLAAVDASNTEAVEELNKAIDENIAKEKESAVVIKSAMLAKIRATREAQRATEEYNQALKHYKENYTLAGMAQKAATGGLAKFVAGLSAGTLAAKAFSQWQDAVNTRTEIMVRNFRGMNETWPNAIKGAYNFEKAIRSVNATAIRLGINQQEAQQTMIEFARIAGTDSPEQLQILTEAAMGLSRKLNIGLGQATEFINIRMNKFGGNAASAALQLQELQKAAETTNNLFGRTVVRTDDVVKTLINISRQSQIYAIDQRLVGNILRDNITRLQSMGNTYEESQKKATNFVEALTSGAPEFMRILAGEELIGNIGKVYDEHAKNFDKFIQDDMIQGIEKARPGTAKKIFEMFKDLRAGNIGAFDAAQLLQEYTSGTEAGMNVMNKRLLGLVDQMGDNAFTVIKQMYGLQSIEEAKALVDSAKNFEKQQKFVQSITKVTYDEATKKMKERYGEEATLSKEQYKAFQGDKELLREYLKMKDVELQKKQDATRLAEAEANAQEAIAQKRGQIAKIEEQIKGTQDKELRRALEQRKQGIELELQSLMPKGAMDNLQGVVEDLKADFLKTSVLTGNFLKELITKIGSLPLLLAGALGTLLVKRMLARMALDKSRNTLLEQIADNTGGGGMGGGTGGGRRKRRRGSIFGRKSGSLRRLARLKGGGMLRGAGRLLGGAGRGLLRGGGGIGALIGGAMALPDIMKAFQTGDVRSGLASLASPALGAAGSAVGGLLGSVVPGAGTAVGAVGGGFLGSMLGEKLADLIRGTSDETADGLAAPGSPANPIAVPPINSLPSSDSAGLSTDGMSGLASAISPDGSVKFVIPNFGDLMKQYHAATTRGMRTA